MKKIWKFFRSIKYGIQNIIKWFPVIWQDRDWDHWFILKIFHFKLNEVEKFQRKYGNSVTHEKKWGDSEFIFTPIKGNKGYSSLDLKVEKANTEEEKKQESKERSILYKHSDALKQQDLDMLFKHMRKYIEGWWD